MLFVSLSQLIPVSVMLVTNHPPSQESVCFLALQVPVKSGHGSSVCGLLTVGDMIMWLRIVCLAPVSGEDRGLCGLDLGLGGTAPSGSLDCTLGSTDHT